MEPLILYLIGLRLLFLLLVPYSLFNDPVVQSQEKNFLSAAFGDECMQLLLQDT
jgi:hypothetical protein